MFQRNFDWTFYAENWNNFNCAVRIGFSVKAEESSGEFTEFNILPLAVTIIAGTFRNFLGRSNRHHTAFNEANCAPLFCEVQYRTDSARLGNKRRKYVSTKEVRSLNALQKYHANSICNNEVESHFLYGDRKLLRCPSASRQPFSWWIHAISSLRGGTNPDEQKRGRRKRGGNRVVFRRKKSPRYFSLDFLFRSPYSRLPLPQHPPFIKKSQSESKNISNVKKAGDGTLEFPRRKTELLIILLYASRYKLSLEPRLAGGKNNPLHRGWRTVRHCVDAILVRFHLRCD